MKNLLTELFKPNSAEETSNLAWLQRWYLSQCDGDWEHSFGVHIDTVDNPGWAVKIDLDGTDLEGAFFDPVTIERTEHDWILASMKDGKVHFYCGPLNLDESLSLFRAWVLNVS